jgi:hypothetical protein
MATHQATKHTMRTTTASSSMRHMAFSLSGALQHIAAQREQLLAVQMCGMLQGACRHRLHGM